MIMGLFGSLLNSEYLRMFGQFNVMVNDFSLNLPVYVEAQRVDKVGASS